MTFKELMTSDTDMVKFNKIKTTLEMANKRYMVDGVEKNYLEEFLRIRGGHEACPVEFPNNGSAGSPSGPIRLAQEVLVIDHHNNVVRRCDSRTEARDLGFREDLSFVELKVSGETCSLPWTMDDPWNATNVFDYGSVKDL